MPSGLANEIRREVYKTWLNLLKEEIDILGKPSIIAIGVTVENLLKKNSFENIHCIPHYGSQVNPLFKKKYEEYLALNLVENIESLDSDLLFNNLKEFSEILMNYIGLDQNTIDKRLNIVFKGKKLTKSLLKRYCVYKHIFQEIAELNK